MGRYKRIQKTYAMSLHGNSPRAIALDLDLKSQARNEEY